MIDKLNSFCVIITKYGVRTFHSKPYKLEQAIELFNKKHFELHNPGKKWEDVPEISEKQREAILKACPGGEFGNGIKYFIKGHPNSDVWAFETLKFFKGDVRRAIQNSMYIRIYGGSKNENIEMMHSSFA